MIRRVHSACDDVQDGRLSPSARAAHLLSCEGCLQASLRNAARRQPPAPRPAATNPAVLWAQAREARRRRAETEIARVILASRIAIAVVLMIPIGLAATLPAAQRLLAAFLALPWASIATAIAGVALGVVFVRLIRASAGPERAAGR